MIISCLDPTKHGPSGLFYTARLMLDGLSLSYTARLMLDGLSLSYLRKSVVLRTTSYMRNTPGAFFRPFAQKSCQLSWDTT